MRQLFRGDWNKCSCGSGGRDSILELIMAFTATIHPDNTAQHERRRALISAAILAFGAVLAYANSFSVPLLFDDWVTILHNPRLRQVWPIWSGRCVVCEVP